MTDKNDGGDKGFAELLSEVESALESIEEPLSDVNELEKLGNDELESLLGDIDTLVRVARKTGELIEVLDLSELPSTVDAGELAEMGTDATGAAKEALGKPDIEDDSKAYQTFIQQQAMKGIDAFRDALLVTYEKFEKWYETNRESCQDTTPSSRNPTAVLTMATNRCDLASGVHHSTVPKQVKTLDGAGSRGRIQPAVRDRTRTTKERTMNDFTHNLRQNQVTTASRTSIGPARAANASIPGSTRTERETGGANRGEYHGA